MRITIFTGAHSLAKKQSIKNSLLRAESFVVGRKECLRWGEHIVVYTIIILYLCTINSKKVEI